MSGWVTWNGRFRIMNLKDRIKSVSSQWSILGLKVAVIPRIALVSTFWWFFDQVCLNQFPVLKMNRPEVGGYKSQFNARTDYKATTLVHFWLHSNANYLWRCWSTKPLIFYRSRRFTRFKLLKMAWIISNRERCALCICLSFGDGCSGSHDHRSRKKRNWTNRFKCDVI